MVKKKKKFSKQKLELYFRYLLAVFVICIAIFFYALNIYSPVTKSVSFRVEQGASITSVTNELQQQKIINSASLFRFAIKLHGNKIMAGEYDLQSGATIWQIAFILSHGKIATTSVTIPEGYTLKQIQHLLKENDYLSGGVTCISDSSVCYLKDGDIFPDTYTVAKGTSRLAVLDLAHQKMLSVKSSLDKGIYPKPLQNWDQVIILASIVQKETAKRSEMPVIAGVYLNRLNKRMKLQACPTVVYAVTKGLGDMQGDALLSEHLKKVSPYNTYLNMGLPPAPIANVGKEAIKAVLKPSKTNFLFFVADGAGGHHFSTTYGEHQIHHNHLRNLKKGKKD